LPTSTPKQPEQCRMSQSIAQQKSAGALYTTVRHNACHTIALNTFVLKETKVANITLNSVPD